MEAITSSKIYYLWPKVRIFLKSTMPLDSKKLAIVSKKWRKKMFFNSQKINCPLARMKSFSQNRFLLIPITVSTSSKIALTKKNTFSTRQKTSSFFENCDCCRNGINGFHQPKNLFSLIKIWSFFKNWLLLNSVTVFAQRKNSELTKTISTRKNVRFHQPEWRNLLKNTFLLDGKKLAGVSEKWREKNGLH